jgi:hypothetical protein
LAGDILTTTQALVSDGVIPTMDGATLIMEVTGMDTIMDTGMVITGVGVIILTMIINMDMLTMGMTIPTEEENPGMGTTIQMSLRMVQVA